MRKLTTYLFQGILIFAPLALTVYIIYVLMNAIDSVVNRFLEELLGVHVWGLGLVTMLLFLVLLGYLCSSYLLRPIMYLVETVMQRTPFVNMLYSSLKDLFSAFVSDQKKFDQPVLVDINPSIGLQKIGFLTQRQLSSFGLDDKVAVYLPHSYNFSGNLFIINKEQVTILENMSSTEAMKFILSGGVTRITTTEINENSTS